MTFRVLGLDPAPFRPLFALNDTQLAALGARRVLVDSCPGYPDRVTLRDTPLGEHVILLNHVSQAADTPYRATHAIYVWQRALERFDAVDVVPETLRRRWLSVRAFDRNGLMRDADLTDGQDLEAMAERLLSDSAVAELHVHHARQGCFAARILRS